MIVKMNFLSITGPKDDIERMVEKYLSKYEIQLENALAVLKTVKDLRAYSGKNPYEEMIRLGEEILPEVPETEKEFPDMTVERTQQLFLEVKEELGEMKDRHAALEKERELCKQSMDKIFPFQELQFDVHRLLSFRHIEYRFGRIAKEYYDVFQRYIYDDMDTIFYECRKDQKYVWGVYFVPDSLSDKVDAAYASMHFEHIFLPDEYEGTAKEAYESLQQKLEGLEKEIAACEQEMAAVIETRRDELAGAMQYLKVRSASFDVRKYAAFTREKGEVYYILCGWMPKKDVEAFKRDLEEGQEKETMVMVEERPEHLFGTPPTELKNWKLFKPFEMYVKMYGLPAYDEMDPTVFVALTYAFIFGAMFGDVGQGLVLLLGGFLLYRIKKIPLAAIIAEAGFFSTIFGFLYGSFFGFEDTVVHHIWLQPKEAMTILPVIGQMNTVFVVAIVFGMFLILTAMILNIAVSMRNRDTENAWFSPNGVAGFIFYGAFMVCLFLVMSGRPVPAGIILALVFGIPVLAMAFKEPLSALIEKKKEKMEGGIGMYLVQTFFEMFEVMLSFFSNTLSFVRVGAFAVSHAAMMEVVMMLAGFENGGGGNWLVVVLGNAFVCAMEGLIVGIQVLRLEYYELFSRYYKGTGHEFKPYQMKNI